MDELKAQIAALTERLTIAENRCGELQDSLEWLRASCEQHDERRCNQIDRLRSDLDEERRQRENEDYHLSNFIRSAESAAENAQRTADSAYSAAQHSGSRW